MDVARYNVRVMGPNHVENVATLACRTALAYRTVSHITIPVDVQSMPVDRAEASERNVPGHNVEVFARGARLPVEDDLRRAADILNRGRRIVIMAGRGALQATDELEALGETLGAVIVKALLGKAPVQDGKIGRAWCREK